MKKDRNRLSGRMNTAGEAVFLQLFATPRKVENPDGKLVYQTDFPTFERKTWRGAPLNVYIEENSKALEMGVRNSGFFGGLCDCVAAGGAF